MVGTIRQLEVFRTVCQAGSYMAAAEALGITQAAVSRHINALETACARPLFTRAPGRPNVLTSAGEHFHLGADSLLESARQLGFSGSMVVPIRVGSDSVILNTILRTSPMEFSSDGRKISADLHTIAVAPEVVMDALELDLAYFTCPIDQQPFANAELLVTYHSGLFAAPHVAFDHALELAHAGVGAILMSQPRARIGLASGMLVAMDDFCPPHAMGRFAIQFGKPTSFVAKMHRYLSELIVSKS
ncbi:hypothetical protein FHW96_001263 [Novosphingobium sp. SG751A]|uniref:LysR family transcriptional regulator n=1 Tax=Novosphingobium sp. SG751A TaxID=2587000 RepID=UPI001553C722|nr:LysR family transcriptional regulator [Novosphingobium sp. SG751A]NOW45108.1 hypothetical protein [Novosphingobium sp. SG751A]